MKPNREERLFELALEKPAAERSEFLQAICGEDAALYKRLEALLAAHELTEGALAERAPAGETMKVEVAEAPDETIGQKIGHYKILEKVGEGGCGVVYVAEQTEPVRRRVALKVIKLGMDTKQVVARFEAERQALAMMDHPNIAKVLDAGSTESGRPYFIMELVRGIRITDYCDQNKLSTHERLDLFIKICQAIQHAHQKGIIHRDIKPSNILVTMHDGVPVPKVIDFGIAKATEGRLTDATVYTQLHQFVGTPAYMSPEQAEMSGLDIDTRSDIYGLGVLLYELLTGKTPFDAEELMSRGIDAMRKTIREQDPVRPSTKLATLQRDELTTTAKRRSVDWSKLLHQLKGDLDWIVMKCLEKDRTRRYETANGLASDIKRHLNNQTVVARPPSRLYEFQKTVRRHKVGFAATAAIIVVLVAGIVMTTWQAVRATHAKSEALAAQARESAQRQIAEADEKKAIIEQQNEAKLRVQAQANEQKAQTEAVRSAEVAQFMKDMLKGVGPSVALGRDTTLLREILDKTAQRLDELTNQPLIEAELRNTIGEVYLALGNADKAEAMHREALGLQRKSIGSENLDIATSLYDLARALHERNNSEAESLHREALRIRRKLLGNQSPDVAASLDNLSRTLRIEGKFTEGVALQREALAIRRTLFGDEHADVATSLHNLANLLCDQNSLSEAETMHRQALAIRRKLFGNEQPDVASSLHDLGQTLRSEGKLAEAEAVQREAVDVRRAVLGESHIRVADSLEELSHTLLLDKRYSEAESAARGSLAILEQKLPDSQAYPERWDSTVFAARSVLGGSLLGERKYAEAEPLLISGYEGLKQREATLSAPLRPRVGEALQRLAQLYEETDRPNQAAALWLNAATKRP